MIISLAGGNSGQRQWQDFVLMSREGIMEYAGGWSNGGAEWGNAAYYGGQQFLVNASTIIIIRDRGAEWEAEVLKGQLPKNFGSTVFDNETPGDKAKRCGLLCRCK